MAKILWCLRNIWLNAKWWLYWRTWGAWTGQEKKEQEKCYVSRHGWCKMDNDRLAEIRQLLDNVKKAWNTEADCWWWTARLFEAARDLLAEVVRLQAELEKVRMVGAELEELYQAERARADMLGKALPDLELPEEAARYSGRHSHLTLYDRWQAAARHIREARGE